MSWQSHDTEKFYQLIGGIENYQAEFKRHLLLLQWKLCKVGHVQAFECLPGKAGI